MPRVKRSVHARKKRRKVLAEAKGYWGQKHLSYRKAKEQILKSDSTPYRDRRTRKRNFRRLWIIRINAAAREQGLSYNQFVAGLPQGRRSSSTARCLPTSRSRTPPPSRRSQTARRPH